MADSTAKALHRSILYLPQDAAALGAGEGGRHANTNPLAVVHQRGIHFHYARFLFHVLWHEIPLLLFCLFASQLSQQNANVGKRQGVIYRHIPQRAEWHTGIKSFLWILYNSYATAPLHG